MDWLGIIVGLVVIYFAWIVFRQIFLLRLTSHVEKLARTTSQKLREWSGERGAEPYSTWEKESDPEQLFVRIISHTVTNQTERGLLLARLQSACKIVELIPGIAISGIQDTDAREEEQNRKVIDNYIVAANQCFSDIKAKL